MASSEKARTSSVFSASLAIDNIASGASMSVAVARAISRKTSSICNDDEGVELIELCVWRKFVVLHIPTSTRIYGRMRDL